jgi:hypothetical protein
LDKLFHHGRHQRPADGCNSRFKRQSGYDLFDRIVLLACCDYLGRYRDPVVPSMSSLLIDCKPTARWLIMAAARPYVGLGGGDRPYSTHKLFRSA